ncbi:hypothetical protein K0T92_12410 [Paenibacillus oenotherae]|uniref:Uncharacterized protein n=1 Tax=Paenibacillus oenotherae TaxID=1435645 RepID=A0ABS7D6N5_9BACL|nr:hypothetical protein [Paenibacillus oenotherae]MBW7475555.1 hypothetical protein [Paenibacillus oenotherae]
MKKRLFTFAMLCLVFMFAAIPVASATTQTIALGDKKSIGYTDGVVSFEFTAPVSRSYTFTLQKIYPIAMTQTLKLYDDQNQLLASNVAYGTSIVTLNLTAGQVVRVDASTTFKAGLYVQ